MAALTRLDPAERFATRCAATGAALVGVAWIALPADWLDQAIDAVGIAALIPLATPPIGMAARAVLALGGGALTAVLVWAALYSLFGPGGRLARGAQEEDGVPIVRRADAHPDAPPRRPLSIAELTRTIGAGDDSGLAIVSPIEHRIPADLDTPLSALDPGAIPVVPREPVRPVAPLVPGERMRTFALVPPPAKPDGPGGATIDALLQRLGGGRAAI